MASLGNALVTKILGHSAAEKAFRPWWDNLEDFLVYGMVMLGKNYKKNIVLKIGRGHKLRKKNPVTQPSKK